MDEVQKYNSFNANYTVYHSVRSSLRLILNVYLQVEFFTLKKEAVRSSEALASFRNATRHHTPEDLNLNLHRREDLRYHM
jgi:hypothetical protein